MFHLDHVVTEEFKGRHWSIPARVYASPLELYAGAPIGAGDFEEELRRLHYRPGDPASGPGFYRRRGNVFDLHARRVRFIDELRDAQLLTITVGATSITGMKQVNGTDVAVFRWIRPSSAVCRRCTARIAWC